MFVVLLLLSTTLLSHQQDDEEASEIALRLAKAVNKARTLEDYQAIYMQPYHSEYCKGKTSDMGHEFMFAQIVNMTEEQWAPYKNEKILMARFVDVEKKVLEYRAEDDSSRKSNYTYDFVAQKNEQGVYLLKSEKCSEK